MRTGRHLQTAFREFSRTGGCKCLETGKEHLAKGEYKTALKYLDQASRHPQTAPEAFDNKMQALFAMELYDSASKSIDAALKEFPENTVAYNYKALLYAKDKKWDEAIDCCDMIIGIRPSSEDAYIAKSELLVKKGDYKKACEAAKDALSINPDSERANFQAAKAFFRTEGIRQSHKPVRKSSRHEPWQRHGQDSEKELAGHVPPYGKKRAQTGVDADG